MYNQNDYISYSKSNDKVACNPGVLSYLSLTDDAKTSIPPIPD